MSVLRRITLLTLPFVLATTPVMANDFDKEKLEKRLAKLGLEIKDIKQSDIKDYWKSYYWWRFIGFAIRRAFHCGNAL